MMRETHSTKGKAFRRFSFWHPTWKAAYWPLSAPGAWVPSKRIISAAPASKRPCSGKTAGGNSLRVPNTGPSTRCSSGWVLLSLHQPTMSLKPWAWTSTGTPTIGFPNKVAVSVGVGFGSGARGVVGDGKMANYSDCLCGLRFWKSPVLFGVALQKPACRRLTIFAYSRKVSYQLLI